MTEMRCEQVELDAAEYALGILPERESLAVAAHLETCPACRAEVDAVAGIGDRLLDLVPDAEPPLGFDRRVMAAVTGAVPDGPRRETLQPSGRRPRAGRLAGRLHRPLAAAAAVVVVAAGSTAVAAHYAHHHSGPDELRGTLLAGARQVGTVYVGGRPAWISMTVEHLASSGPVSCEVTEGDGRVVDLGTFELVDGSGTWGVPEPPGVSDPASARLVAADGTVLARATLGGD